MLMRELSAQSSKLTALPAAFPAAPKLAYPTLCAWAEPGLILKPWESRTLPVEAGPSQHPKRSGQSLSGALINIC
jgi:hypothetical protein